MRRRVRKSPHTSSVVVGGWVTLSSKFLQGLAVFRVVFWGSLKILCWGRVISSAVRVCVGHLYFEMRRRCGQNDG
jgi:hypothetical protein